MSEESRRFCKKCLIPDDVENPEEFLRTYVEQLSPDVRVDENTYKERLDGCETCRHLSNGLCRLCGCFVAVRAAVQVNRCPDCNRVW